MVVSTKTKEKIKRIYEALPKMNCGLCGFESCAKFARAVAREEASPFGCRQDPWAGYTISNIMVANLPVEPTSSAEPVISASREALGQDIRRLSSKVDDILARVENLKARKQ